MKEKKTEGKKKERHHIPRCESADDPPKSGQEDQLGAGGTGRWGMIIAHRGLSYRGSQGCRQPRGCILLFPFQM